MSAAASPSTAPHRHRRRSESIRHEIIAADQPSHRQPPFRPALSRQRPRPHQWAGFTTNRTTNFVALRADRPFTPAHTPMRRRKPITATTPVQPSQARVRGKIPIAPAALSVPNTPRFRALALFGRRPSECVDGLVMPASENLHRCGRSESSSEGLAVNYSQSGVWGSVLGR